MGAKKAATRVRQLSDLAYGNVKGVEERRTSAESTLGLLRNKIGAAGTYETPAPGVNPNTEAPVSETPVSDAIPGGLFKNVTNTASPAGATGKGVGKHIELDTEKAAGTLSQSSAFRQVSRMMAESEQLLARSGPLYDEMISNTQLPIIESSAAAARENTEGLRKAMARGGAARRDAFEAVQKMRSQDQLNMQRGQAIADAHLKLDLWSRDNAKNVIKFADDWSSNQAGVRDSFNTAMDQAAELMSSQALPFMYTTTVKAQEYRDAASAARRSKVNKWITGTLGLVVGAVGAFYGGSGEAMKQFGDMSGKEAAARESGNPGLIQAGKDAYEGVSSLFNRGGSATSADASGNYYGAGGQE